MIVCVCVCYRVCISGEQEGSTEEVPTLETELTGDRTGQDSVYHADYMADRDVPQ